jgi:tripartite ATP-independent transporter DctM subunit
MEPLALLFVTLAAALLVGVPVAFALLLSSLLVIFVADLPRTVVIQQMFNGINAYTLLALPFFFLAGNVMNAGGISERLVRLAMALVGHLRGGLAHVNVVVGMFFAGISGSSTAEAAGIGSVFIPALKRRGYDEKFAVCLTACASTMGVVIPPSILMVVYGATSGASIGALLVGGALPGLLMGLALMVQAHLFAVKYDFPREHPRFLGVPALWQGLKEGIWPAGVPLIIVLGMMGGVFTPTEAASVAAVYALGICLLLYRSLRWRELPGLFAQTTIQFSQVLFCVAGAAIFGWLLAFYRVPDAVTAHLLGVTDDWRVVMLMIVFLFLALGTFMDALPAILIFTPIVQPAAAAVGIHPVHLGVVVVMTLALGLLTPPYGLCTLTACAVAGIPVTRVLKLLHVMMISLAAVVLLCAFVPGIVLWLPRLLMPEWL